jgi:hypothetical protein
VRENTDTEEINKAKDKIIWHKMKFNQSPEKIAERRKNRR